MDTATSAVVCAGLTIGTAWVTGWWKDKQAGRDILSQSIRELREDLKALHVLYQALVDANRKQQQEFFVQIQTEKDKAKDLELRAQRLEIQLSTAQKRNQHLVNEAKEKNENVQ